MTRRVQKSSSFAEIKVQFTKGWYKFLLRVTAGAFGLGKEGQMVKRFQLTSENLPSHPPMIWLQFLHVYFTLLVAVTAGSLGYLAWLLWPHQ